MSKAKCLNCKQIIESKHQHDFVQCKCRSQSDDLNNSFREKLYEYRAEGLKINEGQVHLSCCAFEEIIGHGIFLDGGDQYFRCGGKIEDIKILGVTK